MRYKMAQGFTIDTLKCSNCEHIWTEMPGDREAS